MKSDNNKKKDTAVQILFNLKILGTQQFRIIILKIIIVYFHNEKL